MNDPDQTITNGSGQLENVTQMSTGNNSQWEITNALSNKIYLRKNQMKKHDEPKTNGKPQKNEKPQSNVKPKNSEKTKNTTEASKINVDEIDLTILSSDDDTGVQMSVNKPMLESLTDTVQMINNLVQTELQRKDKKIQELETVVKNVEKQHDDELKHLVDETKKKRWCQNCWKEAAFNTFHPPACSWGCLRQLCGYG